jgi:hypothetical protein
MKLTLGRLSSSLSSSSSCNLSGSLIVIGVGFIEKGCREVGRLLIQEEGDPGSLVCSCRCLHSLPVARHPKLSGGIAAAVGATATGRGAAKGL